MCRQAVKIAYPQKGNFHSLKNIYIQYLHFEDLQISYPLIYPFYMLFRCVVAALHVFSLCFLFILFLQPSVNINQSSSLWA